MAINHLPYLQRIAKGYPSTLSIACRSVAKRLDGFENFHFHHLRHTYTSNHLPLLLCTPSKNISIRTFSIVALFSYSNVSIAVYTRTTSLCNLASKIQGSRVRSDTYEQTRRIFTLPSRKRLKEQQNQPLFLMLSISLKFLWGHKLQWSKYDLKDLKERCN